MAVSLPLSSHAKPLDQFPQAAELERALTREIRGEVRFDRGSRALYATDGSNYRQIPIGLVVPRDAEDVVAAVGVCRTYGAPVLPRGAGTSLAGQCCNVAVVLDFSKYMNRILEIDPARGFARVEPGVVLDSLRNAAEAHRLTFGPDPSTHSRCTLGGMIGNNSCGTHSLLAGKTVDNVEELTVLLYDGSRLTVGATEASAIDAIVDEGGRRGAIYSKLRALAERHADRIRERFPRIPRRVSGYNLDELLPENGFHVARALVGSEGTCAIVLEARVTLIRSPQHRVLVGLGYPDAFAAADHVPEILQFRPIGLEGFEGSMVDGLRKKGAPHLDLVPEGRGYLLVEFGFEEAEETDRTAARFVEWAKQLPGGPDVRRYSNAQARAMWRIREAGPRAAATAPGAPLEWEGWDDAAVAPEKLGSYLRDLRALLDEYEYQTGFYGHFGHGCIHMRVNFDLEIRDRDSQVRGVRRSRSGSGGRLRWLAVRRARRRPVARCAPPEDVRRRPDGRVPRVQDHLGSGQQAQPAQARRRTVADRGSAPGRRLRAAPAAYPLRVPGRRRIDRDGRRCGASASASAGNRTPARCVPATW